MVESDSNVLGYPMQFAQLVAGFSLLFFNFLLVCSLYMYVGGYLLEISTQVAYN